MNAWLDEEDERLRSLYGRVPMDEVVAALPRHTRGSTYKRAKKLGLKGTPWRRYEVNRNFFSSMTIAACYWAGFIAADGCIGKDNGVTIALAGKDRGHLERFVADVAFTGPITDGTSTQKSGAVTSFSRISIWGVPEWHRDLREQFNITARKSLTLRPPSGLSDKQSLAFIVGYIDGDGSIRWGKGGRRKDGTFGRRFYLEVVGTQEMLEWIRGCFEEIVPGAGSTRILQVNNHPALRYSCNKAKALFAKLMEIDCPCRMPRKWIDVTPVVSWGCDHI